MRPCLWPTGSAQYRQHLGDLLGRRRVGEVAAVGRRQCGRVAGRLVCGGEGDDLVLDQPAEGGELLVTLGTACLQLYMRKGGEL